MLRSYQTKRTIFTALVRIPIYSQFVQHRLAIIPGHPPYGIKTNERITKRLLKAFKPVIRNPSPIERAIEYAKVLREPTVASKSQVAMRFGVTRARICQILNLLELNSEIINELMAIDDAHEHNFFTERRLRRLATMDQKEQTDEFKRLRQEARGSLRVQATS